MKKQLLILLMMLIPLTAFSEEAPNKYAGLIEIYRTDKCDEGTGIAVIPIGVKVSCEKIQDLAVYPNRAWGLRVSGTKNCIDIKDSTVRNVCEAYNSSN